MGNDEVQVPVNPEEVQPETSAPTYSSGEEIAVPTSPAEEVQAPAPAPVETIPEAPAPSVPPEEVAAPSAPAAPVETPAPAESQAVTSGVEVPRAVTFGSIFADINALAAVYAPSVASEILLNAAGKIRSAAGAADQTF